MKLINLLIGVGTIAAIAACSNAPSEIDAKKSIENKLGGCRFLSLQNFEKINGIANSNGSYVLEVKYAVTAKVFPEVSKMVADYSTKLSIFHARLAAAIAADDAAKKELSSKYERKSGMKNLDEARAFLLEAEKFQKEVALPANQLVSSIRKERDGFDAEKSAISERFRQECPSLDERFQYLFFDNNQGLSNYTKNVTKDYLDKLIMVKTDNGWVVVN